MDFADLDYQEFELLVGMLLAREGYTITRTPTDGHPTGPDFEVLAADGAVTFVEVKHFRRSGRIPTSVVDQFAGELSRLRKQYSRARGMLVVSGTLMGSAKSAAEAIGELVIWDGAEVQRLIDKHSSVVSSIERVKSRRLETLAQMQSLKSAVAPSESLSSGLARKLAAVPAGRGAWRTYEELGTRILTELFEPELGAPDVQTRSEDGLDIMDAVFPIRASSPPWSLVRSEYQSRFAVAEFKNYVEPIGQKQVESIAQYLWKKAHRSFGLLVSRRSPDPSAHIARRRAWVENDKLIVFLNDEDLIDMAQLSEEDDNPFQVIDAQLEEFFRRLNP